ncbi:hypothetical protein CJ030_MR5G001755 [Morella rubra]|uniref:Uncharacterized protein n=1 Tax=Morella rubra TaxID=262757 RepID=A0A6A1VMC5_9ROSI|nr:hypothetical protein CJ030_MR5G001758 [Morella rubra]KAB1212163.1 hypothetical protein CJ030_MR5G001755 [Morella rubra]
METPKKKMRPRDSLQEQEEHAGYVVADTEDDDDDDDHDVQPKSLTRVVSNADTKPLSQKPIARRPSSHADDRPKKTKKRKENPKKNLENAQDSSGKPKISHSGEDDMAKPRSKKRKNKPSTGPAYVADAPTTDEANTDVAATDPIDDGNTTDAANVKNGMNPAEAFKSQTSNSTKKADVDADDKDASKSIYEMAGTSEMALQGLADRLDELGIKLDWIDGDKVAGLVELWKSFKVAQFECSIKEARFNEEVFQSILSSFH